MRILLLDIETEPHKVGVWGLYEQNVSLEMMDKAGEIMCFSAKFLGEKKEEFHAKWTGGKKKMLRRLWTMLDGADVVCGYNQISFDLRWINGQFVINNMPPPSPYRTIDLMRVVKQNFKFPSNKLAYVLKALGIGSKEKHDGYDTWRGCAAGDIRSQEVMEKYNRRDTTELEPLYHRLLPWVKNHPDRNLYLDEASDVPLCSHCEGKLQRRGFTHTATGRFQRFACMSCGAWHRGTKNLSAKRLTRKDG